MEHPTRSTGEGPTSRTDEERQWPLTAKVAALMAVGVTWTEAWGMSPLDTTRLLMVQAAWRIPPEERVTWAKATDASALAF